MAKKSAASKGYRKTHKPAPFITKRDLKALIVIVGIIVVVALAFYLFYDDGFIGPEEIRTGDIISRAESSEPDRYVRVATINELEGYSMEVLTSPETPTRGYNFTPEDASGSLDSLSVKGAIWPADKMQGVVLNNIMNLGADAVSGPVETEINDNPAFVCAAMFDNFNAEEGGTSSVQKIYCYVTAGEHSVSMTATLEGEDSSIFLPEDQLAGYMGQFAGAYSPIESK